MAQIKIYGLGENLNPIKKTLSNVIHSCVMDALEYPFDKRFHRFSCWTKKIFTLQAGEQKHTRLLRSASLKAERLRLKRD